jgi:hypothetical protein
MKDALGHGSNAGAAQALGQGHPKSAAAPTHDAFANARRDANGDIVSLHPEKPTKEERAKARAYKETLWEHDAPQYHAVVSAKNGRQMGKYSSPDRDAAIKEAFDKHPKARTVMSMRGHGMDMRWHNR